jgi:large subunit ribosomal protein L4
MSSFFKSLDAKKPLVLVKTSDINVIKSISNIEGAKVLNVDSINVYDILNAGNLIATQEAVKAIEEVHSL